MLEEISISWFRDVFTTSPVKEVTLMEAFERIRDGASSEIIGQIRKLNEKADRDIIKKQLPAMTFAGTFLPTRANNNLQIASGLACIDIDHHQNAYAYRDYLIREYDFILAAWLSPSGDGVKALARIPIVANNEEYRAFYKSIMEELGLVEIDNTPDVSRLCFESYDPDLKIKEYDKTSIFNKDVKHINHADLTLSIPNTISNNKVNPILAKLAGRGEVYTESNRNNYIHAFACETNRAGIPEDEVIEYALIKFKEKDQKEIDKSIATIRGVYDRNSDEFGKDLSNELAKMKEMEKATVIEIDTPRPDEPCFLNIEGQPIASLGSFSLISGLRKSRKTHYICFLTAVILNGNLDNHLVNLPPDKKAVIYFDTEQSRGEAWDTLQKIASKAGISNATQLRYYSLRPYTVQEREMFIDYVLSTTSNIGVIVIDGVRDLVIDINNATEATKLFTTLFRWTGDYNIHIFGVLHLNKTDGKIRGHIGSELENKAQSIFKIEKAPDQLPYSKVVFEAGRGIGFPDFAIGYDDKGLPIKVDIEELKTAKPGRKAIKPQDIPLSDHHHKLNLIFKDNTGLKYKEFQTEIHEVYGIGMNSAVDFIKYFIYEKLTYKDKGKYYFQRIRRANELSLNDEFPLEIKNDAPF